VSELTSVSSAKLPYRINGWSVIVSILTVALLSLALSIHALARLRDAAIALAQHGDRITVNGLVSALGMTDAALAVGTVAGIALLARWEWRSRAISRLLATASTTQSLALLTIIVGWLGQAYLFPGLLLGGDTGTHIARFLEVRRGLDAGTLPQWTNYQYLGSSLLGFTGPFTYMVGGALDVLVRDPVVTAKIILFSMHLAAGWLFYALLRRLDFGNLPSLVAAIGFSGSFALLHLFLFRGVFPQAFTIVFFILVFYSAEGLMRGARHIGREWLVFAVSTAGLIVNHQPHALFVGTYLALFGATSLVLGRWSGMGGLKWVVAAGLAGVAISVFAVIPITVEAPWVMIEPESGLLSLRLPTLERLSQLVIWRNARTTWGTDYWAYLGIVLTGLALFGAWSASVGRLGRDRQRLAWSLLPCFVLSFFLYNPVVRNIMFIAFFAGIYAAFGVERIALISKANPRVITIVMLAAILDVASTSVQPVARTDKQYLVDAGLYLERTAPDQRFLEADVARDGSFSMTIGPNATPMSYYSTVQRVAGEHNMAATRVHNYAETAAKMAERDLRLNGRLGPDAEALLQVFNVTRVVCNGTFENGCPIQFADVQSEGPLGNVLAISNAGPAVFSRTLVTLSPPAGLDKPMLWAEDFDPNPPEKNVAAIMEFLHRYLGAAQIDPITHIAEALPVRSLPDDRAQSSQAAEVGWKPRVLDYAVGLQRVRMTVASDGYGYVQLAHPWYPANEVLVNGRRVQPIESAIELTVVPIAPGTSTIEITPRLTPIRVVSNAISVLSLVFVLGFAGMLEIRSRAHSA
jgi:hypothetical protein